MQEKSARLEGAYPPCTMVIFGASGDLTQRKLIPALHSLDCEGLLPKQVHVLGIGRTEMDDEDFRQHLREGVQEHGRFMPDVWDDFAQRLSYLIGGYDDEETYQRLKERLEHMDETMGNRLFYLAVPPVVYPKIIRTLGETGLNRSQAGWARIVVEKPFGKDLESAHRLNDLIHEYFDEERVYRIDHYLGKETVQNLLAFRFANFIFQSLWGRDHVDHVQISALEDVGIGRRAGYYEEAGVVRDMVQNHLLQLLAVTAMEPPAAMNAKELRDEKAKVLRVVEPLTLDNAVFGQYEGYREEPDVEAESNIPTYVALKVHVNNWRWHGVPFFLRSGKMLQRKVTEITLVFKKVPLPIFAKEGDLRPNRLSICIQPDEGMRLRFELKVPGAQMRTSPVSMDFRYEDLFGMAALPEAYERLLLDALQGDPSLFTRSDEIERAWELVTPLLEDWEAMSHPPLKIYEKDTWGPDEADELLMDADRRWMICCNDGEDVE